MRAFYAVVLLLVCLAPSSAETPHEISQRGLRLFELGQYSESEAALREAVVSYREAPVLDVNGYAAALNNLAGTLQTQGKFSVAQELYTEVVSLDSQIHGEDEIVTNALSNMALLHQSNGKYPQAIALINRVLARQGSSRATRARALHNLASIYYELGQLKKARSLFEASLETCKSCPVSRHTPATLAYLGRIAFREGDRARAFLMIEESLALRRQTLAPNHPLVAVSLTELGELYRDTEQYREAAAKFQEALRVLEASDAVDHHYRGIVLFHYAQSRRLQGQQVEAMNLYERALGVLVKAYGPGHVKLLPVYKAAARSAAMLKRKSVADDYMRQASAIDNGLRPYERHTVDVSALTKQPW